MGATPRVPVLMYHKVAPCPRGSLVPGHYVHPRLFERQVRLLRLLGYQTVGLDSLFEEPLPKKPLVVTFDDGYENYFANALPILKRHGFRATVFLVAGLIGDLNRWDADRGDIPERLMTAEQILAAEKEGTEFGSHTKTHADLVAVRTEVARDEIAESKVHIERLLGHPIGTFCYPYGRKTEATEDLVRQAGYRVACSTQGGVNTPETNRLSLRRTNMRKDTHSYVLLYKLLRDYRRA
ncbi:MAG TPA: polysaccharide deacetylase family protein [Fimbriimonas sp.]